MYEQRFDGAGAFKENSLMLYFAGVCVLFTEAFDVGYDNSRSFYKLSCGWVWLIVGFLLGFALLEELCWVVVVL